MTDVDLSTVTLDEMIEELARRYEHVVVITERSAKVDNNQTDLLYDFRGGFSAALGLLVQMQAAMLRNRD